MPRRNRVTPAGEIVAAPERGTLMGNRGVLHDAAGGIRRTWQLKRWIACVLAFKGRRRSVMSPGLYTELFFLDEATALAAGHRPCAECRRGRFDAFRRAWADGTGTGGSPLPTAPQMDDRLHAERVGPGGSQRTHPAGLDDLPDGVFVRHPDRGGVPCLVLGNGLLVWSAGGYTERLPRPNGSEAEVLTPATTVGVIRAGYAPDLHPTARRWQHQKGEMIPLHHDPHYTFRFGDDRIIPRFHLEGVEAGRRVAVFRLDPATGERLGLLTTGVAGDGGWVDVREPLTVRAGDAFIAVLVE